MHLTNILQDLMGETIQCFKMGLKRFLAGFWYGFFNASTSSDLMSAQVPRLPGTLGSGEDYRPIYAVACSLGRQIHTLGWTKIRIPIARSKLAYEVAKQLNWYLKSMVVSLPYGGYSRQVEL